MNIKREAKAGKRVKDGGDDNGLRREDRIAGKSSSPVVTVIVNR